MQTVNVELGQRSYPIQIGEGLLQPEALAAFFRRTVKSQQIALFTNKTLNELYGDQVRHALGGRQVDTFVMGDGEQFKNLATYSQAMDFLMQHRHNRTTCLVALGGGVVGDLTGFVAATFQRGVDFVALPTTLLAQVDSSVGGKTAVNHPAGKNMIGAFYQPRAVIIDSNVLSTLPAREYAAGLAEVVKYGVIADADFFAWLENNIAALQHREPEALAHVIARSCEIKADVVAQDEREGGVRAILNFGHTFGHAIENLAGYGTWLHGEAVAIGMVMAARFSQKVCHFPAAHTQRLIALLAAFDLPISLTAAASTTAMLSAMGLDKKAADGRLRFVLSTQLGSAIVTDNFEQLDLEDVLNDFCSVAS
ncbi:MAG: 3-dehydroquinate synthase [bacterium]